MACLGNPLQNDQVAFIAMYKDEYAKKYALIDIEEQNINNGLEKLASASHQIDELNSCCVQSPEKTS